MFIFFIILFILIILVMCLFLKKQDSKNDVKLDEVKKEVTMCEDTLNLDDLFKTMSIQTIKNDDEFDFGLKKK